MRTLKDLDKSALALAEVCTLILNEETDASQLRDTIFSHITKTQLVESIAIVKDLARPPDDNYREELVSQYGKVRRFLSRLLNDISFQAAPAGKNTLDALVYLARLGASHKQILENPPLDIITKPWRRLVFENNDCISKRGYTLCFLDKLQDSLRRRDIYVANSDRWGDPRVKLLQGADWEANRLKVCRSLGHSVQPSEAIADLTHQLDATYKQVAANFEANHAVRIDDTGKHPSLTITNLDKLEQPPSLVLLSEQVTGLLPRVDLTELILEVNAHTGFADEFTHVSESDARASDLSVSICAVLLSEACNIGLEPLIRHQIPALTRHRLSWVKSNYIRA